MVKIVLHMCFNNKILQNCNFQMIFFHFMNMGTQQIQYKQKYQIMGNRKIPQKMHFLSTKAKTKTVHTYFNH